MSSRIWKAIGRLEILACCVFFVATGSVEWTVCGVALLVLSMCARE